MRRISTFTKYTGQEPIHPQEIVEISPDDSTEGFKCIAIPMKGFRCDMCDCLVYRHGTSSIACEIPFTYEKKRLCSKYQVCLKSLDKVLEDL